MLARRNESKSDEDLYIPSILYRRSELGLTLAMYEVSNEVDPQSNITSGASDERRDMPRKLALQDRSFSSPLEQAT